MLELDSAADPMR